MINLLCFKVMKIPLSILAVSNVKDVDVFEYPFGMFLERFFTVGLDNASLIYCELIDVYPMVYLGN